jgi:phenylacetate-CoA ligase
VRIFSVLEPTARLVQRLNEYQPTLLATYPTAASLLAGEQRCARLAIRPREIWTGGERLAAGHRVYIAETFDCEVHDDYGASEFLAIAWECGRGALHVNADWIILEPVDERYRPVPAGVASHTVLLTNLANLVQPLIRYDLGDSVMRLEGPCECKSPLPAIRVEGRCDDVIALNDAAGRQVKLVPLALTTVLEDHAGVFRFQLLQASETGLILHLDPHVGDADTVQRCRQTLGRFLRTQGLPNVRLDIEQRTLQRHPVSGKLRRVVAMTDAAPAGGG